MKPPSRKTATLIPLAILCGSIAGCVQVRYSEYTGHDSSSYLGAWPIGSGSMAETAYAVPVYRGWPERYYQVLGSVSFPDPNARWNESIVAAAAKEAQKRGADAIVIRQGAEFGVSKIADAKGDPVVVASSYQTTALAIKWLSEQEIRDRELVVEGFLNRFSANDPAVSANQSVAKLVMTLLLQTYYLKDPQLFDHFIEVMSKLVARTPGSLAGEWIHTTTISKISLISGGDDQNSLGLARLAVDGENITIVSRAGGVEINFTGTLSKGRLSGQIGVGGISAKCEGAATPDKISISFQSLTPDGTVHGNIVLQRLPLKAKANEETKPDPSGQRI
jgi:hypothetical protein